MQRLIERMLKKQTRDNEIRKIFDDFDFDTAKKINDPEKKKQTFEKFLNTLADKFENTSVHQIFLRSPENENYKVKYKEIIGHSKDKFKLPTLRTIQLDEKMRDKMINAFQQIPQILKTLEENQQNTNQEHNLNTEFLAFLDQMLQRLEGGQQNSARQSTPSSQETKTQPSASVANQQRRAPQQPQITPEQLAQIFMQAANRRKPTCAQIALGIAGAATRAAWNTSFKTKVTTLGFFGGMFVTGGGLGLALKAGAITHLANSTMENVIEYCRRQR